MPQGADLPEVPDDEGGAGVGLEEVTPTAFLNLRLQVAQLKAEVERLSNRNNTHDVNMDNLKMLQPQGHGQAHSLRHGAGQRPEL